MLKIHLSFYCSGMKSGVYYCVIAVTVSRASYHIVIILASLVAGGDVWCLQQGDWKSWTFPGI